MYNVPRYTPLLNDIHDPVVGIMGVAVMTTPLWLIPILLWLKTVNQTRRRAYNVPRYPPLLNDIHDPVVRIMGVALLTTPL